ncbi:TetR/AcrR family transcriptional regulator [Herbidospora galbida]|uniref:TetR/AcrR family transcriptional regulator n=1 Tax=Herbidospora galbida TaxID=2575442 RepID=A0A4U3MMH9_9ACTN|nr:TetR/AcrR family transcriptional regulator [Herbidospora galbida]TKK90775.1 TetR/AcrR family transcriptional regulator [Herbidospora galbida]
MARPTDTRDRILATARELFLEKGVRDTSLQHIADRLGITKPALYYHFSSRDDLLRTIVMPLIEELEAFLATQSESAQEELLGAYFDLAWQRRDVLVMIISDLAVLHELDLIPRMLAFREELTSLLTGGEPSLGARVRATVAVGGLSDTVVQFAREPYEQVRQAAVAAAVMALRG